MFGRGGLDGGGIDGVLEGLDEDMNVGGDVRRWGGWIEVVGRMYNDWMCG